MEDSCTRPPAESLCWEAVVGTAGATWFDWTLRAAFGASTATVDAGEVLELVSADVVLVSETGNAASGAVPRGFSVVVVSGVDSVASVDADEVVSAAGIGARGVSPLGLAGTTGIGAKGASPLGFAGSGASGASPLGLIGAKVVVVVVVVVAAASG